MKQQEREDWERPIKTVAREDVTTLDQDPTVQEALDAVRKVGLAVARPSMKLTSATGPYVGCYELCRLMRG